MWALLQVVIASGLGALIRHWFGERTWSRVREVARAIGRDPERTSDPREAIEQALLEVRAERIEREAARVAPAVVNGSNPYPKTKG